MAVVLDAGRPIAAVEAQLVAELMRAGVRDIPVSVCIRRCGHSGLPEAVLLRLLECCREHVADPVNDLEIAIDAPSLSPQRVVELRDSITGPITIYLRTPPASRAVVCALDQAIWQALAALSERQVYTLSTVDVQTMSISPS